MTQGDHQSMTAYGIDCHPIFQAGLNIEQVRAEGFDFMAVKVSEGVGTYPGLDWIRRGNACGLMTMGYHYLRPGNEPAQAQVFAAQLKQASVPGMLDAEALAGDGRTATLNIDGIHRFIDAATSLGVSVPFLYLPNWYWQRIGSPGLTGLPRLWASSYVGNGGYAAAIYESVTPRYWAAYGGLPVTILQFTDKALVAGQQVDADAFNGTRDELAAILKTTAPGPPGPITPAQPNAIPPMVYGETSNNVKRLQGWLNKTFPLYSRIPTTGYYGDLTASVIAEFQHRSGIADGDGRNVGPRTAAKLADLGFSE